MNLHSILSKFTDNQELTLDEQVQLQTLMEFLKGKTFEDLSLEYILIRQKERILERIPFDPNGAAAAISILEELWEKFHYSYKTKEILDRIENYRRSLET